MSERVYTIGCPFGGLGADLETFALSSGGAVWVERREHEGALQ